MYIAQTCKCLVPSNQFTFNLFLLFLRLEAGFTRVTIMSSVSIT